MAKKRVFDIVLILQITLAVFFIVLGLQGLVERNSDVAKLGREMRSAFGGDTEVITVIMSVLALISGLVIIGSLFTSIQVKKVDVSIIIAMVSWILIILFKDFIGSKILNNMDDFGFILEWLRVLATDVVILMGLLVVKRNKIA